jgi:hypothetical protein
MKKNLLNTESSSRLERFAGHATNDNHEETIAGRKVSQDETSRRKKADIVKTSIKLPRELKEQTQALARLKQITWVALIEKGLENQLRANAKLMNQFTRYHIDEDIPPDGTSGTSGTSGTNISIDMEE